MGCASSIGVRIPMCGLADSTGIFAPAGALPTITLRADPTAACIYPTCLSAFCLALPHPCFPKPTVGLTDEQPCTFGTKLPRQVPLARDQPQMFV